MSEERIEQLLDLILDIEDPPDVRESWRVLLSVPDQQPSGVKTVMVDAQELRNMHRLFRSSRRLSVRLQKKLDLFVGMPTDPKKWRELNQELADYKKALVGRDKRIQELEAQLKKQLPTLAAAEAEHLRLKALLFDLQESIRNPLPTPEERGPINGG